MSLKELLLDKIKEKGWISTDEAEDIARSNGYKVSNYERRLRPSESPCIEATRNKKGYITGYKYIGMPMPQREPVQCGFSLGAYRFKS